MHVDFLEIGTCDFEIGEGIINPNKLYVLVEPINYYLNRLPDSSNIIKINHAISNIEKIISIFYINEENIIKYNLPYWVRGCNKINEKHPTVIKLLQDLNIKENIFTEDQVESITFETLIRKFNIDTIDKLKIDTEGHDHFIFKTVIDCLYKNIVNINSIKVEYIPAFKNTEEIDVLRKEIENLYPIQKIEGDNLYLNKI